MRSVELNGLEIEAVNRYQSAIAESERDIAKMQEAIQTLLKIVWLRCEGDPNTAFRLGDDKKSLVSVS